MERIDIFLAISQIVIGAIGVMVAFLLYKLNSQNRLDNWRRSLREFHQFFWTDKSCSHVRSWLACDQAYEGVRHVFETRMTNGSISEDEYKFIEQYDRFAALLLAYKRIAPDIPQQADIAYRLFDDYWFGCLTEQKRAALRQYTERFYPDLCSNLPMS